MSPQVRVACHECGGTGVDVANVDNLCCKTCEGIGRIPLDQFDGAPHHVDGLHEHLCAEGWSFPTTETIGPGYSDKLIRLDQSNATLIIRLELPYTDYGELEDLLRDGIESRHARVKALELYGAQAKNRMDSGEIPLRPSDVEYAVSRAKDAERQARDLLSRVRRPPPRVRS